MIALEEGKRVKEGKGGIRKINTYWNATTTITTDVFLHKNKHC